MLATTPIGWIERHLSAARCLLGTDSGKKKNARTRFNPPSAAAIQNGARVPISAPARPPIKNPAAAPQLSAAERYPKRVARRLGSVMSAIYALAADRLPAARPEIATAANSQGMLDADASSSELITNPTLEMSSIGRRPNRSESAPWIGLEKSCMAANSVAVAP